MTRENERDPLTGTEHAEARITYPSPKWRIRVSRELVFPTPPASDARNDELLIHLTDRLESKGADITGGEPGTVTFSGARDLFYRLPTLVGINHGEIAIFQRPSGLTIHYSLDYSRRVGITVLTFVLFGVLSLAGDAPVSSVIVFPAIGVVLAALSTWRSMSRFRAWLTRECKRWVAASQIPGPGNTVN